MFKTATLLSCLMVATMSAGCAGKTATGDSSASSARASAADDAAAGFDPEAFLPQPAARAAADPRENPRAERIAIRGATVLTAAGARHAPGMVVLEGGSIRYVGADDDAAVPEGARVIDAAGRFVTPGIIDSHSHLGVAATPHVDAHGDVNEVVVPVTAGVRAEYGYWPQDPGIVRALAGGVTSALVLPGSANLIGGYGFTVVMRPGRTVEDVRFPGAPATVKMACGENPKRVYRERGGPFTRMGEYAAFRIKFRQAAEYAARWAGYRHRRERWLAGDIPAPAASATTPTAEGQGSAPGAEGSSHELEAALAGGGDGMAAEPAAAAAPEPPPFDLELEALVAVMRGEALPQIHCYRADEIRQMVAIAEEFGFEIRSFHHALGAYKVRDLLIARDISISTWADWWGFKMEAFDGIPENAALFAESGGRAVIHSDSAINIQRLNQEAAKAMWAGRHAGIEISEDQALRWITANPAWALGIDEVTGTLETGKRADVVVWNLHPFSVYARPDTVIQGGEIAYERALGRPLTDFELGNAASQPPRTILDSAATANDGQPSAKGANP